MPRRPFLPDNPDVSMFKRLSLPLSLAVAAVFLASCSSGGSDSPDGLEDAAAGADPADDIDADFPSDDQESDVASLPPGDVVGSNAELEASGGNVTPVQADDLVVGRWSSTDDATQCVTTYGFFPNGSFTLVGLDQQAGGSYSFVDDDGGTEIVFDFEQDNLGTDCFGEMEDTLEEGVTYNRYVNFPDGNTLLLSARPDAGGFVMEFDRQ